MGNVVQEINSSRVVTITSKVETPYPALLLYVKSSYR
jgi:hypothetical protein